MQTIIYFYVRILRKIIIIVVVNIGVYKSVKLFVSKRMNFIWRCRQANRQWVISMLLVLESEEHCIIDTLHGLSKSPRVHDFFPKISRYKNVHSIPYTLYIKWPENSERRNTNIGVQLNYMALNGRQVFRSISML